MKLTIYDRNGNERVTVSPSGDAVQTKEIQGDNVLSLSVTLPGSVAFDVNDYADFMGERYRLTERPHPEMKSRCEWVYNLRMYGVESLLKRFLVLNLTDGDTEPVFTLTAPPAEHLRLIVDCINRGMGSTSWKPGIAAGTENVVIDYAGKYCDQALQELAEKMKAEWWVDGMNVNLCRCEQGEELTLAYGGGLTELVPGTADNVPFYTRLYPVGSSRNIDREKYGAARLLLPGGRKYVDLPLAAQYGIVDRYEQDAFAGIYPRYTGTVGAVRTEKRKDNDGREYTVYFFTDPGLDIDFGAYLLPGQAMRVSFQEGSELAGLGEGDDHFFEVDFNSDRREFEIVTTWPYGDDMQLPGGTLVPKAGDRYIPWNIRMPEEYHRLAEAELADAVDKYNAENARDVAVYRATTDHTWVEATGAELFPGRRVRLEHAGYFPDAGFRSSRITKVVRRLDLPSLVELEIGDALSATGMERMSGEIEGIRNVTRRLSASIPAVIGVADETKPTDYNLFSALRSLREFVSRRHDDRAEGVITFLRGLLFGDGSRGIDPKGNAHLEGIALGDGTHGIGGDGAAVLESIVSKVFAHGLTAGKGWRVRTDKHGRSEMEIDKLMVRMKAVFAMLEIRKVSYLGGDFSFSAAGSEIVRTERRANGWRCWLVADDGSTRTMNDWRKGDMALCKTFNVKAGVYENVANRYYFRLVTDTGEGVLEDGRTYHYVDLSDVRGMVELDVDGTLHRCIGYDMSVENDAPKEGDAIVQRGSQTDPDRQHLFDISLSDGALVFYAGVNDFDTASHAVMRFDPRGSFVMSDRFEVRSYAGGDSRPVVCFRGEWVSGRLYGHYDAVTLDGSQYLCIVGKGKTTSSRPDTAPGEWLLQVRKGLDGLVMNIMTDRGNIIRNGQGEVTLYASLIRGNENVTDTFPKACFSWTRNSGNAEWDGQWNLRHRAAGSIIRVSAEDVFRKAVFECVVEE